MNEGLGAHIWSDTDAYEAYMGRWSRPVAAAVLERLHLPPGLAWLDVGCGTGALTETILATAAPRSIFGVDPSADFLATAATNLADPRVQFAVGDAGALPAPDNAFDAVIAGLVLHFVPDPRLALREMARAARPGGTVAAYVWNFSGERQFAGYFWQAATALDQDAALLDPNERCTICHAEPIVALFEDAGLKAVTLEAIVTPFAYRNFEDYWLPHLLPGSSPAQRYAATLDEQQRLALREQLRTILPIAPDGSITLLGHLWAVRGTKAG